MIQPENPLNTLRGVRPVRPGPAQAAPSRETPGVPGGKTLMAFPEIKPAEEKAAPFSYNRDQLNALAAAQEAQTIGGPNAPVAAPTPPLEASSRPGQPTPSLDAGARQIETDPSEAPRPLGQMVINRPRKQRQFPLTEPAAAAADSQYLTMPELDYGDESEDTADTTTETGSPVTILSEELTPLPDATLQAPIARHTDKEGQALPGNMQQALDDMRDLIRERLQLEQAEPLERPAFWKRADRAAWSQKQQRLAEISDGIEVKKGLLETLSQTPSYNAWRDTQEKPASLARNPREPKFQSYQEVQQARVASYDESKLTKKLYARQRELQAALDNAGFFARRGIQKELDTITKRLEFYSNQLTSDDQRAAA